MTRRRLIATGDHHFDEHRRFAECLKVHDWIAEYVEDARPDAFLSGGDIYERNSTPVERDAVAAWLTRVAAVCPVVVTRGNHDRHLDALLMSRLRSVHPVIVEERAGVHLVGGIAIAGMAWPSRSSVASMIGSPIPHDALDDVVRDALCNVLRGLGVQMDAYADSPRVLLGHFMTDGSRVAVGQPLIGMSMRVGLADLALARAHVILKSHVHLSQEWSVAGVPAVYMGSPYAHDFGEPDTKSITLLEFDGPNLTKLERIRTPAQRMMLLETEWGDGGFYARQFDDVRDGDLVRFRYRVDWDQREAAAASAEQIADVLRGRGATVKVDEEVKAQTRARAPEIAAAVELEDQLQALWKARNDVPEPPRAERLLSMVGELRAEVEAA